MDEPQTPPLQNQDSPILQLPVETVDQIAGYLPPENQIILSQTCSALRNIVHYPKAINKRKDADDKAETLNREQKIRFLIAFSRSIPDTWVCLDCMKMHRLKDMDFPSVQFQSRCPKAGPLDDNNSDGDGGGFSVRSFKLAHRHLQVTLKLARLSETNPEHRARLDRLLAPHHHETASKPWGDSEPQTYQFSAYPKVVDGRYLLHCAWRETRDTKYQILSFEYLGCPQLCRHQHLLEPEWMTFDELRIESLSNSNFAFIRAFREATKTPGATVRETCTQCPTDFAACVSRESIVVSAWMDLGPEGMVEDVNWGVFANGGVDRAGKKVERLPGRVRELYEGEE